MTVGSKKMYIGLSFLVGLVLLFQNCSNIKSMTVVELPSDGSNAFTKDSASDDPQIAIEQAPQVPVMTGHPGDAPVNASCNNDEYLEGRTCKNCFQVNDLQDGSQAKPFLISTCHCLQGLGTVSPFEPAGIHYKLANDIDCRGSVSMDPEAFEHFRPITLFSGIFDGNNKTIKNLKIVKKDVPQTFSQATMFYDLKGSIQNLNFEDVLIEAKTMTPYMGLGHASATVVTGGGAYAGRQALLRNITVKRAKVTGQYEAACIAGYFRGDVQNISCTDAEIEAQGRAGLEQSQIRWVVAAGLILSYNSPQPDLQAPTWSGGIFKGSIKGTHVAGAVYSSGGNISELSLQPQLLAEGPSGGEHINASGVVGWNRGQINGVSISQGNIAMRAPASQYARTLAASGIVHLNEGKIENVNAQININADVDGGANTVMINSGIGFNCKSPFNKNLLGEGNINVVSRGLFITNKSHQAEKLWGFKWGNCGEENVRSNHVVSVQ